MTKKEDFTAEEWQCIVSAPPMVGMAVAAASPSGPVGTVKEMVALGKALEEVAERGNSNGFISAVVADLKGRVTQPAAQERIASAEAAKEHALSQLRKASEILFRKVSDAEGQRYKRWLVTLAERVAEAAKEGSVLGFGGKLVSDEERSAIRQIAFALGIPATG
ncbi:MAG: hypothetical protein ACREXS_13085 [Gammaproteobacteria bacterium]